MAVFHAIQWHKPLDAVTQSSFWPALHLLTPRSVKVVFTAIKALYIKCLVYFGQRSWYQFVSSIYRRCTRDPCSVLVQGHCERQYGLVDALPTVLRPNKRLTCVSHLICCGLLLAQRCSTILQRLSPWRAWAQDKHVCPIDSMPLLVLWEGAPYTGTRIYDVGYNQFASRSCWVTRESHPAHASDQACTWQFLVGIVAEAGSELPRSLSPRF